MKSKILFGLLFLLLMSSALATQTVTWDESYTNTSGLQTLQSRYCGGAAGAVEWTTISWTDGSVNTTNCVDTARCRPSGTNTYQAWKTTGQSVAINADRLECQWNLTVTNSSVGNCTVSGFNAVCGGYAEAYGAADAATASIDGIVAFIAMIASVAGLIVLAIVLGYATKKWRR